MISAPPSHAFVSLLRDVPGQRRVLRTRVNDADCVTRILLVERVHPTQESLIRQIALHGRGSLTGVPESVALTLEGYRVAARLDEGARHRPDGSPLWPKAVAAGLTAELHVFVTTTWMPGTPLHEVAHTLTGEERETVALDVLGILVRLHGAHVAWGDLKTENIVLGPDRRAALIDLDTLREVPDEHTAAVTRDLTRAWAAPEQERQQQTFLASDLWAWAHLVERLWFGSPPEAWRPLLATCRHEDPLRRPHTAELLAALQGDTPGGRPPPAPEHIRDWMDRPLVLHVPVESTERVPEAPASPSAPTPVQVQTGTEPGTERVPETPSPPTPPAVRSPPVGPPPVGSPPIGGPTIGSPNLGAPGTPERTASPDRPGCMRYVLGAIGAAALLCGLGGVWGLVEGYSASGDRVEQLESALKAFKTKKELNTKAQRDVLLELAKPSWFQIDTARWKALAGLAEVWAAGWQDAKHRWDDEDQALADRLLRDLDGNDQPEAHLALGTTQTALCRLPAAALDTGPHCTAALAELAAFFDTVPDDTDHDWIRVEAAWNVVLVDSTLAEAAYADHLPAEDVRTQARNGLEQCAAAELWLPRAPVNGPELVQDCLVLAGLAEDLALYGHYASLLVAADAPPIDSSTMKHLYQAAAPGCSAVTVTRSRGDWSVKGDPWCLAVGHYARGCVDASLDVIARNGTADATHPWASLQMALTTLPSSSTCAR